MITVMLLLLSSLLILAFGFKSIIVLFVLALGVVLGLIVYLYSFYKNKYGDYYYN